MYTIRDREAGNVISTFDTQEEAQQALVLYEAEDKLEDIFVYNFYEIVEDKTRENVNTKLLEEFNQMDRMPIFEINWADYGSDTQDDWEIFYITADINGLYCNEIKIDWDDYLNLYEHLQLLFEAITEKKL